MFVVLCACIFNLQDGIVLQKSFSFLILLFPRLLVLIKKKNVLSVTAFFLSDGGEGFYL